jgi:ribosomal protein S18 acetylase RimI-like enzyme
MSLFDELSREQRGWRVFRPRRGVRAEMEARYQRAMGDPRAALLVAEHGGEVVGLALGVVDRPSSLSDDVGLDLSSVVVRASHRRRGIGRALASAAASFAQEQGVGVMVLRTFGGNQAALAFWSRLGFEPRIIQMVARSEDVGPH